MYVSTKLEVFSSTEYSNVPICFTKFSSVHKAILIFSGTLLTYPFFLFCSTILKVSEKYNSNSFPLSSSGNLFPTTWSYTYLF